MAGISENYGLAVGVVTDEIIEPDHHNRLAATVDRVVGKVIRKLLADGAHAGWELTLEGQVAAGEGLVAGCWCETSADQDATGLIADAVNFVFAHTTSVSAPDGAVAFMAQLSPEKPDGAVYLGSMTLDEAGEVTGVDNNAPGVDRNCFRLEIGETSGSGVLEGFYGLDEGAMAPIEVDHEEEFRWAEPPRFAEAPGVIFLLDTSCTDGTRFRVMALRTDEVGGGWTGGTADLEYSWTRTGGLR
jgi:hypothetical protein